MNVTADHVLFFTSADDGGGPGGWQVRWEVSAGLAPVPGLRDQLLGWVRTDLEPAGELPRFPTAAQREQFPRRLEHRRLSDAHSGLWHAIPAGTDGSGRPGNVAVTAVALPAAHPAGSHVIDFWRSASFPTPFGPIEVAAACAPNFPDIATGELAEPHRIGNFLLPPYPDPVRVGLLARILDAADAAVRNGGPKLALVVADSDEAAHWIAAICAFAPPGWGATFTWSTWERAQHLLDPAVAPLHLVAVPKVDLDALTRGAHARILIVPEIDLDPELDEPTSDAALGTLMWRFSSGARVPIGQWSRIATQCAADGPGPLAATMRMLRVLASGQAVADPARDLAWARASASVASGDAAAASSYVEDVLAQPGWMLGAEPPHPIALADGHIRFGRANEKAELLARRMGTAAGDSLVELGAEGIRTLDFLAACGIEFQAAKLVTALVDTLSGPLGIQVLQRAGITRSATLLDQLDLSGSRQSRLLASLLRDLNSQPEEPAVTQVPAERGTHEASPNTPIAVERSDWLDNVQALAQRTAAWDRGGGPATSQSFRQAREHLTAACIVPDSAFLLSPVIAGCEPGIRIGLAFLALHHTGGKPPAARTYTDALNLLQGYLVLQQVPAAGELLEYYLPDALLAVAVLERFRGRAAAREAVARLGADRVATGIKMGLAQRLESLMQETPADWQLSNSQVLAELLGDRQPGDADPTWPQSARPRWTVPLVSGRTQP